MALGLPPLAVGARALNSSLNSSGVEATASVQKAKGGVASAAAGGRQIAKKEISAPTNFRHVVRGLDEYGLNSSASKDGAKSTTAAGRDG